ncbi:hypothetical protein BMR05_12415 [Methylococcaceae bacterium HT4]|nr:hypothetical protein BMR11_15615 [Methylococcaceae bacterium CS5]TXL02553.1 hypothetical protein BMR09_16650 [Methylococcaceae bacterium CS3]TXL03043.1 hypothetical protein BMR08_17550 [Methylococcaceae bacterium CS2]TXL04614.1 hypothetical protein BMR07_11965 [Methylococcaceae bacterium CS1]TXL13227.1 hypothetical protein BMR05_12415 [Methylococcaceae bacterium HT4]TXL18531.1 hypothetical protein BMR06_13550 [Methylococcaceae bacterium HT5]TXL21315.1 hypothetical protein BMR03_13525 [Meth
MHIPKDLFDAVELSRLCLVKDARNLSKDMDPPHGINDNSDQPKETDIIKLLPNQHKLNRMIIWGLFYAAAKYGYNNNIQYCYFMTSSILARLLRKSGLNLTSIGGSSQHKGERFPFKMNVLESYKNKMWQGAYNCNYQLFSDLRER